MCAGSGIDANDVLDLLSQLANKSLIVVLEHAGRVQYRLLESLRQYALERFVASGEADAVQRRYEAYDLALFEEKTIRDFLVGERLKEIPASRKKRQAVLKWLAGFRCKPRVMSRFRGC